MEGVIEAYNTEIEKHKSSMMECSKDLLKYGTVCSEDISTLLSKYGNYYETMLRACLDELGKIEPKAQTRKIKETLERR